MKLSFAIVLFAISLICALSARGATSVDSTQIQVSTTHAVIPISTGQASCTVTLTDANGILADDVNPALFAGSDLDTRASSVINRSMHYFVAGSPPGVALDGWVHSRSLAAGMHYNGTATCGGDPVANFWFTTLTIQVGNVHVEPIPFVSGALGNYGLEHVDFTQQTKFYVDPETGFRFAMITHPGEMVAGSLTLCGSVSSCPGGQGIGGNGTIPAAVLSSTNWSNPTNLYASNWGAGSTYATYSTVGQDVLMARLEGSNVQGTPLAFNWNNIAGGSGNGGQTNSVDAIQLMFNALASSAQSIQVALSFNGVTQGTEWESVALTTSDASYKYPANQVSPPVPPVGFAGWQGANFPLIPANLIQLMEQHSNVNTAGTVVTLSNGFFGNTFPLDARVLTAGSKVTICATGSMPCTGAVEYTIASVDSALQITLTSSAGTNSGVLIYWNNFSVMIRKAAAVSGTISIGNLEVLDYISENFNSDGSGFKNYCSPISTTDGSGNTGRLCTFITLAGHEGIYWVTNAGTSRFLGRFAILASGGAGADDWNFGLIDSDSLFDASDPNSVYALVSLVSGGVTLVRMTYNPGGIIGCAVPAHYQALVPQSYSPNGLDSCQFTFTNMTKPSLGLGINTQISNFTCAGGISCGSIVGGPLSGKFPSGPGLSFVQNGYAVLTIENGQDYEAWNVTVNVTTGVVQGVYSNYMNSGKASCRGCSLHAPVSGSPTDPWYSLAHNTLSHGANSGQGPYLLNITTALTGSPSISLAACAALVTDPAVVGLLPYADGCDQVAYTGADHVPCWPTPSAWALANAPACSWSYSAGGILPGASTQWGAGALQIGDWFWDTNIGYETFVVGAISGSNLILIRNINPPKGPGLTQQPGINGTGSPPTGGYLKVHSANWQAEVLCNFPGTGFETTADVNGSGMIHDPELDAAGHLVQRNNGIVSDVIYAFSQGPTGKSVRTGAFQTVHGLPETNAVLIDATFSGAQGAGCCAWAQSHPGWDSANNYFTDQGPMANGSGNIYLWPNTGMTVVTGSLYKISAANNNANTGLTLDPRRLGTAAWAGAYNFQDVSGTGSIGGSAGDNYKYCIVTYAGATCGQGGEALGDIFINIPQATIDHAGFMFDLNTPGIISMGQEMLALQQFFYYHLTPYPVENMGRWERRIGNGMARYAGQDGFSNSKIIFGTNLLMFPVTAPNMQRTEDLAVGFAPTETIDPVARNTFANLAVNVPAGTVTPYTEIRFGYPDNGSKTDLFCTTRHEACGTAAPVGQPFGWIAEGSRVAQNCSGGCTINIPVLSNKAVYYGRWDSTDGVTWSQNLKFGDPVNGLRVSVTN